MALCGLWEAGDIAALFVPDFGHVQAFVWNHIIVSILLMLAGVRAARTRKADAARTLPWLAAAAGARLLNTSFILGNPMIALGLWKDIIVAVIG